VRESRQPHHLSLLIASTRMRGPAARGGTRRRGHRGRDVEEVAKEACEDTFTPRRPFGTHRFGARRHRQDREPDAHGDQDPVRHRPLRTAASRPARRRTTASSPHARDDEEQARRSASPHGTRADLDGATSVAITNLLTVATPHHPPHHLHTRRRTGASPQGPAAGRAGTHVTGGVQRMAGLPQRSHRPLDHPGMRRIVGGGNQEHAGGRQLGCNRPSRAAGRTCQTLAIQPNDFKSCASC